MSEFSSAFIILFLLFLYFSVKLINQAKTRHGLILITISSVVICKILSQAVADLFFYFDYQTIMILAPVTLSLYICEFFSHRGKKKKAV